MSSDAVPSHVASSSSLSSNHNNDNGSSNADNAMFGKMTYFDTAAAVTSMGTTNNNNNNNDGLNPRVAPSSNQHFEDFSAPQSLNNNGSNAASSNNMSVMMMMIAQQQQQQGMQQPPMNHSYGNGNNDSCSLGANAAFGTTSAPKVASTSLPPSLTATLGDSRTSAASQPLTFNDLDGILQAAEDVLEDDFPFGGGTNSSHAHDGIGANGSNNNTATGDAMGMPSSMFDPTPIGDNLNIVDEVPLANFGGFFNGSSSNSNEANGNSYGAAINNNNIGNFDGIFNQPANMNMSMNNTNAVNGNNPNSLFAPMDSWNVSSSNDNNSNNNNNLCGMDNVACMPGFYCNNGNSMNGCAPQNNGGQMSAIDLLFPTMFPGAANQQHSQLNNANMGMGLDMNINIGSWNQADNCPPSNPNPNKRLKMQQQQQQFLQQSFDEAGLAGSVPSNLNINVANPSSAAAVFEDTNTLLNGNNKRTMIQGDLVMSSPDAAAATTSKNSTTINSKFRFRSYQSEMWQERLEELQKFRKENGHCLVPHNWSVNLPLAQWVKRQRYQMKLKLEGKHSTMTTERQEILENLGFIWDSHKAAWEERLHELRQFCSNHGHTNVPSTYPENPQLSVWVKCQRRQYKLYVKNQKTNLTEERKMQLDSLGFVWNPRNLQTCR
eukprot:CAMPEP_0119556036 /NCGR_PEP_ID=MMETSP1352-20130426/8089_1 /TAXON_ID=265584 /ORGANISM="Stauroneis constricta, Strain CCMP1120" /LENGTH=660 /DNA_ID=CAMNT_0007602925 /DNA_START=261 /DNA_END=2243 /DNA_ORIENTATION=-